MNNELTCYSQFSAVNILKQLPELMLCTDLNHKVVNASNVAAKCLGFNTQEEILGEHISNIKVKAVECTPQFIKQNEVVIEEQTKLNIIDIHPYMNDEILFFLVKKTPFFDKNNNVIGSICYGAQINQSMLFNITMEIIKADRRYKPNNNIDQRSYAIVNKFKKCDLSARESECLFYLLRGKSVSAVANILQLSTRTIETYVENLKIKMGCPTKSAVIEKAIEYNLIDLIPENIFKRGNTNISIVV